MSIRKIGSDKDKSAQLQSGFGTVLNANKSQTNDDGWIKKIGKAEKIDLPSGAVLLTGKAAEEKAMKTAKAAWQPSDDLKLSSSGGYGKSRSKFAYLSLEDYLKKKNDPNSEYSEDRGITYILGVYDNIIITTDMTGLFGETEIAPADRDKLLVDIVRSLEKIAEVLKRIKHKKNETLEQKKFVDDAKNILARVKGENYPLVLRAKINSGGSGANAAETGKNFFKNFDSIDHSPYYALRNKAGQVIPSWISLFHELTHIFYFDEKRRDYKRSSPNDTLYPRGNAYAFNYFQPYVDDRDAFYAYVPLDKREEEKENFSFGESKKTAPANGIDDFEDYAVRLEQVVYAYLNIDGRKDYDDSKGKIRIDDPLTSRPIEK